jgi:hypothetical protein
MKEMQGNGQAYFLLSYVYIYYIIKCSVLFRKGREYFNIMNAQIIKG